MGRKAKRAKMLVRKMRITGQEIDPVIARCTGVDKQNQQLIDAREAEAQRLVEEAQRKEREALEAKQKAEAERKEREALIAKQKAEIQIEAKKKAATKTRTQATKKKTQTTKKKTQATKKKTTSSEE